MTPHGAQETGVSECQGTRKARPLRRIPNDTPSTTRHKLPSSIINDYGRAVLTLDRDSGVRDSEVASQQLRSEGAAAPERRHGLRNLVTEALIVVLLLVVVVVVIAGGNFSRDRAPDSIPRSIPRSTPR